jgi:hypothetical protein
MKNGIFGGEITRSLLISGQQPKRHQTNGRHEVVDEKGAII